MKLKANITKRICSLLLIVGMLFSSSAFALTVGALSGTLDDLLSGKPGLEDVTGLYDGDSLRDGVFGDAVQKNKFDPEDEYWVLVYFGGESIADAYEEAGTDLDLTDYASGAEAAALRAGLGQKHNAFLGALDAPLTALTGEEEVFSVPGVERPRWQRVPLLGDIACGEPILAEENLEGYVEVDASVRCDFTLRCRGDSMEPRLHDGDIVMIRIQPDVLDGQIAAVLIGGEATLKHVYHLPGRAGLRLMPENPAHAPIFVTPDNADDARILGRAVAYQRMIP